jgi:7-cyano-7-deazaguanine synthase
MISYHKAGAPLYQDKLASRLTKMAISAEDRGRDGTGVTIVYGDGKTASWKSNLRASKCAIELEHFLSSNLAQQCVVIGNDRYQPMSQPDSGTNDKARQPIETVGCVGTHNGTFSEDDLICEKYGFTLETGIDSEVLLHLYRHKLENDPRPYDTEDSRRQQAIRDSLKEIAGGYAYAMVDLLKAPTTLQLFRNFKPLTIAFHDDEFGEVVYFNSEKKNILAGLDKKLDPNGLFDSSLKFQEVPTYTGMTFDTLQVKSVTTWDASNKLLTHLPNVNKERKRALVIASGGMDSALAAAVARKVEHNEVTLLHMNYGQRAYEREVEACQAIAKALDCDHVEVDAGMIGKWDTQSPLVKGGAEIPIGMRSAESTLCWVAARNLVFLTMAAAFAEGQGFQNIYTGFGLEESGVYNDNCIGAFDSFNKAMDYFTQTRVKVRLALGRLMKAQIVRLAYHLGVPMGHTWSCDSAGVAMEDQPVVRKMFSSGDHDGKTKGDLRSYLPDGTCGCCFTRRLAHKKANILDSQAYANELIGPVPEWYKTNTFRVDDTPIAELIAEVQKQLH